MLLRFTAYLAVARHGKAWPGQCSACEELIDQDR
jgi:hypothetical protein